MKKINDRLGRYANSPLTSLAGLLVLVLGGALLLRIIQMKEFLEALALLVGWGLLNAGDAKKR